MVQSFAFMCERLKELERQSLVVAAAHDEDVLRALVKAADLGLVNPILIGDKARTLAIAHEQALNLSSFDIIESPDDQASCLQAVQLVRQGRAKAIMKGLVATATLFKAILNRETGIRERPLLSHLGLFFVKQTGRMTMITDAAMNIAPDLAAKKAIIENAVTAAHKLGIKEPKVASVCALETVNPAMQATVEAAQLVAMNQSGEIQGCLLGGPLALDNALFLEAARHKGIKDPVAGRADILLMPNIEAGNDLYKALAFLCQDPGAGLVLGAQAPVIVTSRSDNDQTKLNSIILALYLSALKED